MNPQITQMEADLKRRDALTYEIIGTAMAVHRELGHGFLEAVYQVALANEFNHLGIPFQKEQHLPVSYRGEVIAEYQADFICYDKIIVELKALQKLSGVEEAQVINYLKATGLQRGLLINFGARSLQQKRLVFTHQKGSTDYADGRRLRESEKIICENRRNLRMRIRRCGMIEQAQFSLRGRNPDVLTCIANLSNDEVFTPPEFANRMLDTLAEAWAASNDGANIWEDKTVTFLDPCTKSGVFCIEGCRALGDNVIETIINKAEKIKYLKKKAKEGELTKKEKKELSDEEREFKSKRKLVQEKLIKFATRIPAFMYLTDFRENTLQDVITKIEPDLFETVTGLTVKDFHLLVRLRVFNTEQMNAAVFAFRRYEDASLRYTGIESHDGLTHYGLYDTVVAREEVPR